MNKEEQTKRLIELGICVRCKKNPASDGYKRCKECREYNRNNARKHSKRKRSDYLAQGICPSCRKNLLVNGKARCQECLDKEAKRMAQKRQDAPVLLCKSCLKNPALEGMTKCETCSQKDIERMRVWREKQPADKCLKCHQPKPADDGHVLCEDCRKKRTEQVMAQYHERVVAGVCANCGGQIEEESPSTRLCTSCWRLSAARRRKSHSKSRYNGQLEAIIERDKACAICGRPYGVRKNPVVCHHIDGDVSNNDHSNLVLLCRRCHGAVEGWKSLSPQHRVVLQDFVQQHYPIDY